MATLAVADPAAAYCAFLRASLGDQLASSTNPKTPGVILPAVFRPSMPPWFDASMPAAAIVVRPGGGYSQFGKTQLYIADPRHDVICYGTSQQDATDLCRRVAVITKRLAVQVWEGTLLYRANVAGGPIPLPDQQTLWPGCWLAVQLIHGELPQPANAA